MCAFAGFHSRCTAELLIHSGYSLHSIPFLVTETPGDVQILGVSVDSQFSHLAWIQTERNAGGLGDLAYPLVSDLKKEMSAAYDVLTEDGIALRGLFIIDKEGIVQHSTINNLAFGRNVEETLRVLQVGVPLRLVKRFGSL